MNIASILKEFEEKFTIGGTYWKKEEEWESFGNQTQADAVKSFLQEKLEALLGEIQEDILEMRVVIKTDKYGLGKIANSSLESAAAIIEAKK